jgi:hypothetical protein
MSRRKRKPEGFSSFLGDAVEVLGLVQLSESRLPPKHFLDEVALHGCFEDDARLMPSLERDQSAKAQRSCRVVQHARAEVG